MLCMVLNALTQYPLHSFQARRQRRLLVNKRFSFVHISKCGGSSFIQRLRQAFLYWFPYSDYGAEHSVFYQKQNFPADYSLVVLRSPRRHVWSLYSMCRYSDWGKTLIINSNFPNKGPDIPAIGKWLDAHLDGHGKPVTNTASQRRFVGHCYEPSNYQARALTSEAMYPHRTADGGDPAEPNITAAMQRYWEQDWVGLTEFFHESV